MPTQNDFFDADNAELWVQPDGPNGDVYLIPCANSDGITAPAGDPTIRMCRTPQGWVVSHQSQGAPGMSTMTIDTYLSRVQNWLSRQVDRGCPIPVYLNHGACLTGTFLNYDVYDLMRSGIITSKGMGGGVRGQIDAGGGAADATTRTFELNGHPGSPEVYPLQLAIREIAEAEQLNDIDFCNDPRCTGACGVLEDACIDGMITAEMTGLAIADVWFTANGWVTGGGQVGPFLADETVTAGVCFYTGRNTVRHIVARGTTSGLAAEISYTDDAGGTWNDVLFGLATEYVIYGGSMHALDESHIWVGLDSGDIYFSDDGGATWTTQASPLASAIYAIHFVDANYGMAVGAANVFAYTTDGGVHWTAGTGPNAGVILTGVQVIDSNRAWICCADGDLYYTNDFGTAWTQRQLQTTPDALGDIFMLDEYAGACCGFRTVSGTEYGVIYRTFNGGRHWEEYLHDVAFDSAATYGLNAVWMCDYNHIFAVGEPANSLGLIMELTNALPS